jgi:nicotinamide-nucleotide amidase
MQSLLEMGSPVGELLKARGEKVAISESSAGGLISAALLAVAGASTYYKGGGVVYTGRAMHTILQIDLKSHKGIRSSSEPYAELAAEAIRSRFSATWGLAETGAAGPNGNGYGDASGHTCIAIAGPTNKVITLETGQEDREANMWAFAQASLELFEDMLRA